MNILIVYPKYQKTEWSLSSIFQRGSDKSEFPPKESLLISTLLPITWDRKYKDLNKERLRRKDILWADYIFVSAHDKQSQSAIQTICKCHSLGRKIVACGSLFTEYFEDFENVEHLVLDDFRITLPQVIYDLENNIPRKVYHSNAFFEIKRYSESYYSLKSISGRFSQRIHISYA